MGLWPGRRAGNAVRATQWAGTAGSVMGETAEIVGGERQTHSRRHTHWDNGVDGRRVTIVRDELRQIGVEIGELEKDPEMKERKK